MAIAQQVNVAVGVAVVCGLCAAPLYFKSVRDKEMVVAQARDEYYEGFKHVGSKDDAREQRMSVKR